MRIDSPRRREHLKAVADRLPAHLERLTWTADQIAQERQRALRETLAHAKANSPWYCERLARVDPDTFTEADLTSLPIMTKTDVMENWDDIVTDRRLTLAGANAHITAKLRGETHDYYYLDDTEIFATGGSSGTRGVFVWGWNEFIEIACITNRYQSRDEPPSPGKETGRRLLAVIEAGETVHGSPFLFSVTPDPHTDVRWFPAASPMADLVAELNKAQPTHINGFASTVQALAGEALAGRLKIRPKHVATNSEPLMPEARTLVKQAWNIDINNMWGCVEVGHIGIECDAHEGLHLSDDAIITEFVDHDDRPVANPEDVEKVLVTSLFNRVQPIIRYELTDMAIPAATPCSCGAVYPLVREIRGRADDAFRYAGGIAIHPLLFRTPLGQNPMIEEYQVRQTEDGASVAVVARGDVDIGQIKSDIVVALKAGGLTDPHIEIVMVDRIARHRETGKLKRFLPLG